MTNPTDAARLGDLRRSANPHPIARLRMERGLTQAQLAELMGVPQQHISRWERRERNPAGKNLLKLCKILNCTLADLMQ